ncbi:MAG: molybdenum cofactor guanylyltransferase [Bacillota bacterium]
MRGVSAIVLSGGRSTRMKANKAFIEIGSQPLLERIVNDLKQEFAEVILSTNEPHLYHGINVKLVQDIIPYRGPINGIHAGLSATAYSHAFVVACDMPFMDVKLAAFLADLAVGYDVVVPVVNGHYQPLYAVYSKACLPYIEENLKQNIYRIAAFYDHVRVRRVQASEIEMLVDKHKVFFNVNTPEDLAKAHEMSKSGGRKTGEKS